MTTYTTIPDTDVDQDSPITVSLMTALRDNVDATMEGASGAPRLDGKACVVPSAMATELSAVIVTAANSPTLEDLAGCRRSSSNSTTNNTSLTECLRIDIDAFSGTIRFGCSHRSSGGGATSTLEVQKNGSTVNTWTTTSTSPVARSQDISIAPGDYVRWRHKIQNSSYNSVISSTFEGASDALTRIGVLVKLSEWV